jgi:hypothetical protein
MKRLLALTAIVGILAPVALLAKGETTRITITDNRTGQSISLTEPVTLAAFNVWSGHGTFSGSTGREVESTEGFIIDWPEGQVASRPNGLRQYEVKFYVRYRNGATEQLAYVVLYETNESRSEGFVYLPGRSDQTYRLNVQAISRGVEGNWFRASRAWQNVVGPLLRNR